MASVNDLAIDLGTSNILIYMKGKGIILREPTVVAIDRDTRDVLAFGEEARRMIGRTPSNILAIRPLREGVISDYELVSYMLKGFVLKAIGKHMFARPRAVLSLPTGVNEMERRSIISTMFDAGMRRTQLLDRTIAAAIGAGLPIDEAYGTMIVDISAGVSDVAVLSLGKVVVSDCSKVGGDKLDDAIIRYLRRKHNLLIGERTAEELKINIGSAIPRSDQLYMESSKAPTATISAFRKRNGFQRFTAITELSLLIFRSWKTTALSVPLDTERLCTSAISTVLPTIGVRGCHRHHPDNRLPPMVYI